MEYKIENVDVSALARKSHKFPFHLLEVGQSFSLPNEIVKEVRAAAAYQVMKTGKKFSIKKDGECYRCGRIK